MVKTTIKNKLALLIFVPVLFIACDITDTEQGNTPTDSSKIELKKERLKPIRTHFHQSACGSGIATQ